MDNKTVAGFVVGSVALGFVLGFAGSNVLKKPTKQDTHVASTCSINGGADTSVTTVMTVDGKDYTEETLPMDLKTSMYDAKHEAHEKMSGQLKEFAARVILAKEQKKDTDPEKLPQLPDLLDKSTPSETDIKQFYEANKGRIPPGTTFEQVKPQLVEYLSRQKQGELLRSKMDQLEKEGKYKIHMTEPAAPFVKIDLPEHPSRGADNAAVTVVEVSDYLCPHCQRVQGEVDEMLKKHGNAIKFIQVNFALRPDALNGTLARGAFCARKQGDDKFWEWHTQTFKPENTSSSDEKAVIEGLVKKVGLKNDDFQKCISSDEAKAFVTTTGDKMHGYGVSGTPTFFINGQRLGHGSIAEAVNAAVLAKK